MPKPTPHEIYGDLTKKEEADLREYFSYAPCYELEKAIAGVRFDKEGSLILPKRMRKIIKHEEEAFDDDDLFDNGELLVNYEED